MGGELEETLTLLRNGPCCPSTDIALATSPIQSIAVLNAYSPKQQRLTMESSKREEDIEERKDARIVVLLGPVDSGKTLALRSFFETHTEYEQFRPILSPQAIFGKWNFSEIDNTFLRRVMSHPSVPHRFQARLSKQVVNPMHLRTHCNTPQVQLLLHILQESRGIVVVQSLDACASLQDWLAKLEKHFRVDVTIVRMNHYAAGDTEKIEEQQRFAIRQLGSRLNGPSLSSEPRHARLLVSRLE